MSKPAKIQIVLATWAGQDGYAYFGNRDLADLDKITSAWLLLRSHIPDKERPYFNEEASAINDLGLWVWVSLDGSISIDLRVRAIHTASVSEMERRTKLLRRLWRSTSKRYPLDSFVKSTDVHAEITKALDALGVRQAVEYHGISKPDTYTQAGIAVRRIADTIERRIQSMGGWQLAPDRLAA